MNTWRGLITEALGDNCAAWGDVEAMTLTEAELDEPFGQGAKSREGRPFTLWTKWRVYFPACYDGQVWVASVPRHPGRDYGLKNEATSHVGG